MTKPVEIEIHYDHAPQSELALKAPELSQSIAVCQVTDQDSLNHANGIILAATEWLKAVDRIMDPVRDATHKAWKASIAAQDEFKSPVEKPLAILKKTAVKYLADVQEAKLRKQREADEEQRKANEADAKRKAAELKAWGASKEEIKEAKEEIKSRTAPDVQAEATAPSGTSLKMLYSAEVTDLKIFLSAMVQDDFLLTLFGYSAAFKKAIESELRGVATDRKDKYEIPGTKLVKTPSGAWRR